MIIEYKLSSEEFKEAIQHWLSLRHKVKGEQIISIEPKPFPDWNKQIIVVTIDTNKRYPEGKD